VASAVGPKPVVKPPVADPRLLKKPTVRKRELEVDKLFTALVKLEGSDLHLKVDLPPHVRVKGTLRPLNRGPIDDEEMERLLIPMMDDRNRKIYEETGGADFAHVVLVDDIRWRFRVNILRQLGHIGLVARRVNNRVPNFEGLFLPPVMESLCKFDQGMILSPSARIPT
jgi:twitching motility protein PilT